MPIDLDDLHDDFDTDGAESYNDHAHTGQNNNNNISSNSINSEETQAPNLAKLSFRDREILRRRNQPSEDMDSRWDEFKI